MYLNIRSILVTVRMFKYQTHPASDWTAYIEAR